MLHKTEKYKALRDVLGLFLLCNILIFPLITFLPIHDLLNPLIKKCTGSYYERLLPPFRNSAGLRVFVLLYIATTCYIWCKITNQPFLIPQKRHLAPSIIHYSQGLLASLILMTIVKLTTLQLFKGGIIILYQKLPLLLPNALFIVLFSAFTSTAEELQFRHYTLHRLLPSWKTDTTVAIQALLFGLVHFIPYYLLYNHPIPKGLLISTTIGGIFFGYARVHKKSLALCIGLHSGIHLSNTLNLLFTGHHNIQHTFLKNLLTLPGQNIGGLLGQTTLLLTAFYLRYLHRQQTHQKIQDKE